MTSIQLSLTDKECRDSAPFRSIVSRANKSKSSLCIDSLDICFPLDKIVIVKFKRYLQIITEYLLFTLQ